MKIQLTSFPRNWSTWWWLKIKSSYLLLVHMQCVKTNEGIHPKHGKFRGVCFSTPKNVSKSATILTTKFLDISACVIHKNLKNLGTKVILLHLIRNEFSLHLFWEDILQQQGGVGDEWNSLKPSQPWRLGICLAKTTEMLLSDQLNQLDCKLSFRFCFFAMSSFTDNYCRLMGASPIRWTYPDRRNKFRIPRNFLLICVGEGLTG